MSKLQRQEYRGNGEHSWEEVSEAPSVMTIRLRVPGGWLYNVDDGDQFTTTFVPMPEVVKHKV